MSTTNIQDDDETPLLLGENRPISIADHPVDKSKVNNSFLYFSALVALQAPLVMGYAIGYSSPAGPDMDKRGVIKAKSAEATWFGSLLNIGAIFGGPIAGFLLQHAGRKLSVMCCALPFVAGWVLIGTSGNLICLYAGRVLTGVGTGMVSLATPNYISEIATPETRGFLGTSFQVAVTVGILLVYALGIPLPYYWLSIAAAVLTAVLLVTMVVVPETPRFLLIKHWRNEALQVLAKLRGPHIDPDIECREIEDALDNSDETFSWKEFSKPTLYKPLMISMFLMFVQQFCGINAVMFYTVEIFQSASSSFNPNVATVIVGVVQVVFTCVAAVLMDRMGRRVLLLIAAIGMAVSCIAFGVYYYLISQNENYKAQLSWLSITCIIIYIMFFALGWGPIPWLLMSEIFPSKAKGAASAIATAFNWTCSFIVTKEFEDMTAAFHQYGVFWFYGAVCVLGAVFVALFVPETKGRTLEEIEAGFSGEKPRSR